MSAGLVALLVVAVIAMVIALHTDWGRDQVRAQLEGALEDKLAGEVHIGRLEGSVLGDVVLRDVVIEDAAGAPAITIAELRLAYPLSPLLWREVQLDRVVATGVVVHGRQEADGSFNLATLVLPSDQPLAWDVIVSSLQIRDARLELERGGERWHLDAITLDGRVTVRDAAARIDGAVRLGGTWRERGLPIALDAALRVDGEVLTVSTAAASAGALAVTARQVRMVGLGDQLAGEATVTAPAAALLALWPASPLRGDVALALRARPGDAGTTVVALNGKVGAASIAGELAVAPATRRVTGAVDVAGVDLSALLAGGLATAIDARIGVDLVVEAGPPTARSALRGEVTVHGGGTILDLSARDVDGQAVIGDGRAQVHLVASGAGDTHAVLDADVGFAAGSDWITIDRSHLVARAGDLVAASAGRSPVRGALAVDLTAQGRIGPTGLALAVQGEAHGQRLALGDLRIRSLDAVIDATGLPATPGGALHAEARGVTMRGLPAGRLTVDARSRPDRVIAVQARSWPARSPWRIDADALVRIGAKKVDVALGRHRLRTNGVDWIGQGGAIEIDRARVMVRGLRTTIAGGRLAVDGTYHHDGRRLGDLTAAVALDDVDLAAVDRSLELGGAALALRGTADLVARVERRRGGWSGSVDGGVRGLAIRDGVTPVDVTVEAISRPGFLELEAAVRGARLGALTLALDVEAPRRLDDLRAWSRLPRAAIHHGHLTLEQVDLAALARFAGVEPPAIGRLDGELLLTATDTTGTLTAHGVEADALPAPLAATLTLAQPAAGLVEARIDATVQGLGTGAASVTVGVPARPFDLAAWRRLDATAVRGATLRIADVELTADLSRRLGLPGPWQGRASVAVVVAAGLSSADVTVDAIGVRGGPLAGRVDLHVEGRADRHRLTATVAAGLGGPWLLTAEAAVAVTPRQLWDGGVAALWAAPLTSSVTVEQASLRTILRAFGRDEDVTGTLTVAAAIAGTVGAPTGTAEVTVADLGTGGARLRALQVTAGYDGATVTVAARGRQGDGGSLAIDGRAALAALDQATARITAERFDLAPLSSLMPTALLGVAGILDADLRIRGAALATGTIEGELRLRQARLPLGATLGTLRRGEVVLTIDGGVLAITAAGRIGDGQVTAHATGRLAGLLPERADVVIEIDDLTVMNALQPRVDTRIAAVVKRDGDLWRVVADVTGTTVVLPDTEGRELHEPGAPDDMVFLDDGQPPAQGAPRRARRLAFGVRPRHPLLIAEIRLRRTTVRSEEFRGQVKGRLTVTADEGAIAIDGTVDVVQADVVLFDRRYRVERAGLRFDGGDDPLIDVRLVHEFPSVAMYLGLRGRLSNPKLELSSQPATYTEGQLFGFLLGGSPGGAPGTETRDAASGLASSVLSQKIGGYLDDYLPVDLDVLRFDAATASDSASFTLGKWITRRLFVAYRRRLESGPEQNAGEAELEYWLTPRIMVQGVVGDRGYHDLDLVWVRRW